MIKLLIYIYAFYIIYMPPFSDLYLGIPTQYISAILLIVVFIIYFAIKSESRIRLSNYNIVLYLGITLASLYFATRAMIGNNDLRILQNLFILVQFAHVLIIFEFLKMNNFTKISMIKFLLNLATFQAIIGVIMLIVPEFKNIALQLYYLGGTENIFISQMRIYGLSGDYTFFTPIYHGTLAIIATVLALFKNAKLAFYLPFIFIIILLNGRFGLIIYVVSISFVLLFYLLRAKVPKNWTVFTGSITIMFTILFTFIAIKAPYTFGWLLGGVNDTIVLLTTGKLQGNYAALMESHLFFPEGLKIIFGEGHRVYAAEGKLHGFKSSDIGYVNDLFMGGLIYIGILYGTIIWYLLKGIKTMDTLTKAVVYSLIIALLLANYKGEVMRSGTVLLGILFIKVIIMYQPDGKEKKEKNNLIN